MALLGRTCDFCGAAAATLAGGNYVACESHKDSEMIDLERSSSSSSPPFSGSGDGGKSPTGAIDGQEPPWSRSRSPRASMSPTVAASSNNSSRSDDLFVLRRIPGRRHSLPSSTRHGSAHSPLDVRSEPSDSDSVLADFVAGDATTPVILDADVNPSASEASRGRNHRNTRGSPHGSLSARAKRRLLGGLLSRASPAAAAPSPPTPASASADEATDRRDAAVLASIPLQRNGTDHQDGTVAVVEAASEAATNSGEGMNRRRRATVATWSSSRPSGVAVNDDRRSASGGRGGDGSGGDDGLHYRQRSARTVENISGVEPMFARWPDPVPEGDDITFLVTSPPGGRRRRKRRSAETVEAAAAVGTETAGGGTSAVENPQEDGESMGSRTLQEPYVPCIVCFEDSELKRSARCSDGHAMCHACLTAYVTRTLMPQGTVFWDRIICGGSSTCGFLFGPSVTGALPRSIVREVETKQMDASYLVAGERDPTSNKWLLKNSKDCPNCGVPIQRIAGCAHMACSVCRHQFWYTCTCEWPKHTRHCSRPL